MVLLEGKYSFERHENLDAYLKEVGMPYVPRKMVCASSPTLEISKSDDEWKIALINFFSNSVVTFRLGQEYEETTPGGTFKNVTILEGNKFITKSKGPNNINVTRTYEVFDEGCVIEYVHDKTGVAAKRYFKRV